MVATKGARRTCVVLAGLCACVLLAVPALASSAPGPAEQSAPRQGPTKQGWWSRTNDEALPTALPAPPDVPDNGLYVASIADDVQAMAAVTYRAAKPRTLTLTVADSPGGEPSVVACPLKTSSLSYEPAENGTWQDAPEADCDRASVEGKVDEDAGTIAFDVRNLARRGLLAVAVLPVGTTRVAFEKPGARSLASVAVKPTSATTPIPATPQPDVVPTSPDSKAVEPAASGEGAPLPAADEVETATPAEPDPAPALVPPPTPRASIETGGTDTGAGTFAADTPIAAVRPTPLTTRVAQLLAMLVAFGLLLYYAEGHGILGARYDR